MHNYFLKQLDKATTSDELDQLLNEDKYMAIINSSGWDITRVIDLQSKGDLIQGLILKEVVGKRETDHRTKEGVTSSPGSELATQISPTS